MHSWDMLVQEPLSVADLDDRNIHVGHEQEDQCTFCGKGTNGPWYPIEDVTIIRHWNVDSIDEPGGGHWTWYCPHHLERRRGNWWKSSHLAPRHLKPEIVHDCDHIFGTTMKCGDPAVEPFDGTWLCDTHAKSARLRRAQAALFSDEEDKGLLG